LQRAHWYDGYGGRNDGRRRGAVGQENTLLHRETGEAGYVSFSFVAYGAEYFSRDFLVIEDMAVMERL
jgi:hypothetical protein